MRIFRVGIGERIRIGTPVDPNLNIELIIREMEGTKRNKTGKVEVRGSPNIEDGFIVELTNRALLGLAPDIV